MGRAVHQLEKETSFRLGTGVEYVSLNYKGRAIRQFEKEVSFRLATGEVLSHWQFKKMATAVSVESLAQNRSFMSIEN